MLTKVVRTAIGLILIFAGLPMLLAGSVLWYTTAHQSPGGGFSAGLSPVASDGYAVVVPDVDTLLREHVPLARGGSTDLHLAADTHDDRPAFVGLAAPGDVDAYLGDSPYTRVDEVRLARGPLPVATSRMAGSGAPAGPPAAQSFWVRSGTGSLEWSPHEQRGEDLSLVVMDLEAQAPLTVAASARLSPHWLTPTTVGALVLGTLLLAGAVAVLTRPRRPPREVVYVVSPGQVPEFAAQLGVPVPQYAQPQRYPGHSSSGDHGPGAGGAGTGDAGTGVGTGPVGADSVAPAGPAGGDAAGGTDAEEEPRPTGDRPVSATPLLLAASAELAGKRPAGTAQLLATPAAPGSVTHWPLRRPERRPETLEDLPTPPPEWPMPEENRPTSAPTPVSTATY